MKPLCHHVARATVTYQQNMVIPVSLHNIPFHLHHSYASLTGYCEQTTYSGQWHNRLAIIEDVISTTHLLLCKNMNVWWVGWFAHQGSKAGWRLAWLLMGPLSPVIPEPRFWLPLSWKELSGLGEGTVTETRKSKHRGNKGKMKTIWLNHLNRTAHMKHQGTRFRKGDL